MRRVRVWLIRLGATFRRDRREAELAAELESHIAMHVEENVRAGMTREEARRDALVKLGGVEQTKEAYRERRGLPWLDATVQDVRFGVRMLRKSPGFTVIAMVTLALGIGANTAIFSLVNALMLHAAPVRDPRTLVELLRRYPGEPAFNGFSWDAYRVLRQNHVLSDLIVDSHEIFVVRSQALEQQTVFGGYLSGTFFESLGLQSAIGCLLGPEADDLSHPAPVAVVSWAFWRRNFDLDPRILGQHIIVNDTPVIIIGVVQQGFSGLNEEMSQDVWLPLSMKPVIHGSPLGWGSMGLDLVGRLKPGVSLKQAHRELDVLFQSAIQAPDVSPFVRKMKFELQPAASGLSSPIRQMLRTPVLVLMIITSLVLLIACANLAGLLSARGTSRRQEMAVRVCLGAGRLRLLRQVLTESLLLSLFGGLLAIVLAYFGGRWLLRMITSGRDIVWLPVHAEVLARPDSHVLLFTAVITLVTALLFGVLPALGLSSEPTAALQQVARIGESRPRRLLGKSLIATQVAITTALLSLAVLFVGYVQHLRSADLGFHRDHLLLLNLDPGHSGYDAAQWSRLSQELLVQLEALPGVRFATFSATTPMLGAGASSFAAVKGQPQNHHEVSINYVAPRYFETYGTSLLRGRDFSFTDEHGPLVAIINEAMARDFFDSDDPIGRYMILDHVTLRGNDTPIYEIVGVVGDAKYNDLHQPAPRTIYLHAFQEGRVVSQLTLRTAVNPESVTSAASDCVTSLLKTVPIVRVTTMTDQIDATIVPERLTATLSSCFGVLAALLASIGLYGLLAYSVSRRTNEIGVRMALGANRHDVVQLVLGEGFKIVTTGVVAGIGVSFALTRFMRSLLYGVGPTNPLTLAVVAVLFWLVGLAACYMPARRAARVDPMVALRYE